VSLLYIAMTTSSSSFTSATSVPVGPPLIGAHLRMAFETVQRGMLEGLHAAGFDDLDLSHLTVLQYPGPDGMRPSALAARLRMSKQALNYMLGELERTGYLERRPDPDDLRARRIALTSRGHEIILMIRKAVRATERQWADALGGDRVEELRSLLVEIHALHEPGDTG
jgi:DNA-binding MarR family transcriptional regulator